MKVSRFKNCQIGDVFDHNAAVSRVSEEWIQRADSLRELSLNTPLCDVLIANTVTVPIKNNSGGNHVIKDIFAYRKRTSGAIVKRTPALDSTHRIWLIKLWNEVLIADEEFCESGFKNCRIWNIFNYCRKMSNGVAKQRARLGSVYQIDISTLWRSVLTADEGILSWRFKNWKIVNIFNYCGSIRRDITKWMFWLNLYH